MPYARRRRTYRRRRPTRTRRFGLRRARTYRYRARNVRGGIASFKEKFMSVQLSSNAAVTVDVALNEIAAGQLAAYQALYRSFKITGVKLTFFPDFGGTEYNQATYNLSGSVNFGGVLRCTLIPRQCGDLVAPTSEADALESQNAKTFVLSNGKPRSFYFRSPHFVSDLESATEYTFKTGWLSTNSGADINHNVAQWWMQSEGTGTNPYHVMTTLYFKCKDPI